MFGIFETWPYVKNRNHFKPSSDSSGSLHVTEELSTLRFCDVSGWLPTTPRKYEVSEYFFSDSFIPFADRTSDHERDKKKFHLI